MLTQDDYTVTLDAFCGPLDLLLYLVRRAEVDIHDIPIARITDQYLELLGRLRDVDIDDAGDFLVMAATLIECKSRTLMPPEELSEGADAGADTAAESELVDPRGRLIRQLLDYQRFRLAGEGLEERRVEFARRFACRPARGAIPGLPDEPEAPELELEDVHVLDLSGAYERIMGSIDFTRLGDHTVEIDDTPIALHQEDLLDRLRHSADGSLTLQAAFTGHNRPQRVGLFLAALELVRLRRITVRQESIDEPVEMVLEEGRQEGAESATAGD